MKATKGIVLAVITISAAVMLLIWDYASKKRTFQRMQTEYETSIQWESVTKLVNRYFFEHGWFPDSLNQVDTIFHHRIHDASLDEIRETPYRFLVDPFSGEFYRYIPLMNARYNRPEGFYLISAGIDSKFNNSDAASAPELKLYDSANFSYFDSYFGKKDLLVSKGSIQDWTEGMEVTLRWLAKKIDANAQKRIPRNVRFSGMIEAIDSNYFSIRDTGSELRANCYFSPSTESDAKLGEIVQVNGIYNRVTLEGDTTFIFFNCVIVKKE